MTNIDKVHKIKRLISEEHKGIGSDLNFSIQCRSQSGCNFCFVANTEIGDMRVFTCWGIELEECLNNALAVLEGKTPKFFDQP